MVILRAIKPMLIAKPDRRLVLMEAPEAVSLILEKLKLLRGTENLPEAYAEFAAEKLVADILDYCHREDFPAALIYTAVDLVGKRLDDFASSTSSDDSMADIQAHGLLSAIKMDDTEFHFAVENAKASGIQSDYDFDSIKSRLNLYRRMVSLP